MFKKVLTMMLVGALAASMIGCGGSENGKPSATPTTSQPTATPTQGVVERTDLPGDASSYVSFEDGASEFAKIAYSFAACNLSSTLKVGDFAGGKALLAAAPACDNIFSGSHAFVAIDIVSLLGDKAADVKKVQYDVGIDFKGGKFQAVAGQAGFVTGAANTTSTQNWTIFLEEQNPKAYTFELPEAIDPSAQNYIYFTVLDGNPIADTDFDFAIDNLVFYAADGSVITPDTKAGFTTVEGLDESFWLNLVWDNATKQPTNEKVIFSGVTTGTGWWPDAKNSVSFIEQTAKDNGYAGYINPDDFGPGMVLTIYYEQSVKEPGNSWQIPYLRAQSWADAETGWAGGNFDVWNFVDADAEGNYAPTEARNNDRTIVQYSYEEIAAAANKALGTEGEDWEPHLSFMGVADRGLAVTIHKVTIGTVE